MGESLRIVLPPGVKTEIKEGVEARWHRGRIQVEMQDQCAVAPGPASLTFYEQILPAIYGDSLTQLVQPIAKFTVDRVKQALYWETRSGNRLYIFPHKNQTGKIGAFETWIE